MNCHTGIRLPQILLHVLLSVLLSYNSFKVLALNTTATTTTTTTLHDQRLIRLKLATIEFVNKFGPLQSSYTPIKADEDEDDDDDANGSNSNSSNALTAIKPQQQKQQLNIGNFFTSIIETVFNPTTRCRLGFKSSCICREDSFRRAILRAGSSFDNPTPITLCTGTITLTTQYELDVQYKPINITNKSFFIGCTPTTKKKWLRRRPASSCTISGNGQYRMFYGNPVQLFLQNIQLINGNATAAPTSDQPNQVRMSSVYRNSACQFVANNISEMMRFACPALTNIFLLFWYHEITIAIKDDN
jgi:hypothetical protein